MKNNEQGRSMIEMLGVLAIVGLLSIAGISLYNKALYQRKVSTTIDQISELMANMRNIYKSRRTYTFTMPTSPEDDEKKIIPDSMWLKSGNNWTITTALPLDDNGYEFANECGENNRKCIGISLKYTIKNSVSVNSCVKIATSDWGKGVKVCVDETCNCGSDIKVADCSAIMDITTALTTCYEKGSHTITFQIK